jgi:hypothetical protein
VLEVSTAMSSRILVPLALTAAVVVAIGFSLRSAQRSGSERRRSLIPETSPALQSLKRLRCSFPDKFGDPVVWFDKIDTDDGTAEVGGFFRRRDQNVNVKLVGSNLHFLDVALDGGLTVVTVFAKETHDGRLRAVYSRAANPDAAQYTGDCEASR